MENISYPKDLLQIENLNKLSQLVNNIFIDREFNLALEVKRRLIKFLGKFKSYEKDFQSGFKIIKIIVIKLIFFTLNRMPLDKLAFFFKDHWTEQYEIPDFIDSKLNTLNNFFEVILLSLPYDERDEYKLTIAKALRENKQILIDTDYQVVGSDNKSTKITVASLLLDFDSFRRHNQLDNLLILKYLDSIAIKNKLTGIDKEKIQHLLNFYKILLTSSLADEGAEEVFVFQDENDDTLKVFNKGIVEELKDKNIQKIVNDIFETYGDEEQKQFASEFSSKLLNNYRLNKISEKEINKKFKNWPASHTKEFENFFHLAINKREPMQIVISLFKLAREGFLDEIFERDVKIKDIFKAHLTKKFSDKLAQHFENNLRQPVYLSYFLQHLLKDILKLNENESAVLAIKLVNELKRAGDKQYLPIAYGDLKEGNFKWKAIIEKGEELQLEK